MPISRHGGGYSAVAAADTEKNEGPVSKPVVLENSRAKYLQALAACLLWLVCSSTIILINKYIMVRPVVLHFEFEGLQSASQRSAKSALWLRGARM